MTADDLFDLIAQARELHRLTRDPLLPSAVELLSRAASAAMQHPEAPPALTPQQQIAVRMVRRMEAARLTLMGFSDMNVSHERRDQTNDS